MNNENAVRCTPFTGEYGGTEHFGARAWLGRNVDRQAHLFGGTWFRNLMETGLWKRR